jgi:hypothetical protein
MQGSRSLANTNKQICDRHLRKSTYEKEMLAILHVVDIWHPYFLGHHFKIKINYSSLKYFLEKIISSQEQQK